MSSFFERNPKLQIKINDRKGWMLVLQTAEMGGS